MVMMVRGRHVCLYGWSLLLLGLWKVGDNCWLLVVVSEDWANEGTMSNSLLLRAIICALGSYHLFLEVGPGARCAIITCMVDGVE